MERLLILALLAACAFAPPPAFAGEAAAASTSTVPDYFDARERLPQPDISDYPRIRFLTTTDFPPFNFVDQTGQLAGFHVDLARAICEELDVADKCQIQALPWDELKPALEEGKGEAIIAGLAISQKTRADYAFTRSYLHLPARFVRNRDTTMGGDTAAALAGQTVGVVAGSAHEAMLQAFFPKIRAKAFDDEGAMLDAVKQKAVAAGFGDGLRLSFWLASKAAGDCCGFFDGPYASQHFLGQGLAIATLKKNRSLVLAFDHALLSMSRDGRFAEIYRRYFPISMY